MSFRAVYISYADYGGPLIHTKEFVQAFRKLLPDLKIYCPFLDQRITLGKPSPETFFNKLFLRFPPWVRQLKLEFYQLRKLLKDFAKWPGFYKLYSQNSIDVVVVRNDAYIMAPVYAANKCGIPFILETNGVLSKDKPDRVTRWFEKYVLTTSAGIFAVSEPLAELLFALDVPRSKVRVIPNGVNLSLYESPDMSVIPLGLLERIKNKKVIGYVGTFTDNHDVSSVVSGFAQALSEMTELCLLLVGYGKLFPKIKEEVENLGVSDKVIFTGAIPHDEVPAYLKLCHILANPMCQVYEESFIGVPIKMFEYMASKRPIVSTDMPNLRQLLGESAIFVPEKRPDKWRETLIVLAKDSNLIEIKGKQAYQQLIKKGYTWEENARKVYEFCNDVLKN